MNMITKFLLNTKHIHRSAVIWNALSAMMNSFQTMVLLMVITRFGTMDDSSIFVMAYAVGNLMLNVGKFGVRQFQVTDTNEVYGFYAYRDARTWSTVLMMVLSVAYVGYNIAFNSYDMQKSVVVLLICAVKAVEAYEDVYHGLMQQQGRLDVAAKILGVRLTVFVVGCAVLFLLTRNLLLTVTVNFILTVLLSLLLNRFAMRGLHYPCGKSDHSGVGRLMLECFPLCACMCMNMYIANAPKYTIDAVVDSEVQTLFNIVFMPVFVIALLANFIFQPYLKSFGEIWAANDRKGFVKKTWLLSGVVVAVCAVVTAAGMLVGIPLLELVYKVDLTGYHRLLLVFMLAGGVIALQNLLIMAITVVRCQKHMIYGYALVSVVTLLGGNPILVRYDIFGLSVFFLLMMVLLLLYCVGLLFVTVKKTKQG